MALVSLVPNILVVTPSVPVNTMADVIAYAKAAPAVSTWLRPATARCSIFPSKCSAS